MKVILISGHAQNGKDSTANFLAEELRASSHKVLIAHYGDLVKYVCKQMFDWDGEKDEHGRTLLQYVGTDIVRSIDQNYWVRFISDMLSFFNGEWDYVLIPDCRFPNEVECLRARGFDATHVRVIRSNFVSPLTEEQQKHPSETALDLSAPDYYVHNDGTLDDLKNKVSKFTFDLLGFHQMHFSELGGVWNEKVNYSR